MALTSSTRLQGEGPEKKLVKKKKTIFVCSGGSKRAEKGFSSLPERENRFGAEESDQRLGVKRKGDISYKLGERMSGFSAEELMVPKISPYKWGT